VGSPGRETFQMPPMATPDIHNIKGVATSEEIIQLSLLYVGKIVAYIARIWEGEIYV
jgi:hypothetical protein